MIIFIITESANAAEEVFAQFGNYGPQKGDFPATISAQEQQRQTVEAIEAFLSQRDN